MTVGSGVLGIEPGSEKAQVSFEKEGKRRITAMGSYLVAVMGKTAPFGTFLVTARPGS